MLSFQGGSSSGADEVSQRIEALKTRRQTQRTKLILTAAGKGDLEGLKQALKVK